MLSGEMFSCYSMTEPHAGADPTMFTTRAELDGDEWVINGWKWFSSNARTASFLIVMVVTNPDVSAYQGMSMFLVPTDTPGVEVVRNVGVGQEPEDDGGHAYVRYNTCGCRPRTCSAARAAPSTWPDPVSAAVAPPRHAHRRCRGTLPRHAVRAGASAAPPRASCWPRSR